MVRKRVRGKKGGVPEVKKNQAGPMEINKGGPKTELKAREGTRGRG